MNQLDPQKTLFLIDGSSFLYRAYYGLRPLHTKQGIPVQAVYSFCRMIKKLMDTFNPRYMALVWDSKGKTARHEIYPEYKGTRQEAPSDLFIQKEFIQKFADLIGLSQIQQVGIEADDLMYSIAKDYENSDTTVVLITSDKDMGQVLSMRNVQLFDAFKDQFIDRAAFVQKMGFEPEKLPFYFALVGDTSDNIPGVPGIGPKGATDLVTQFASLEDAYTHLDRISKERTKTLLVEHKEKAFLSQTLFLLRYTKLDTLFDSFSFTPSNWRNAQPLFLELDFKSLLKEIGSFEQQGPQVNLSSLKGYQFKTITTAEALSALCSEIKHAQIMAFDTELTGLDPLQDSLVGLSICVHKGISYYVPFGHSTGEQQLSRQEALSILKPILTDPAIQKIMHSANFDQRALAHYGIVMQGLSFDTLLAAHLITQDWQRIGLKSLSEYYLQEKMLSYADVVTANNYKNFSYVPLSLATEYAASDAHQTMQLYPILQKELKRQSMETLYEAIELPLVDILVAMEARGIYLDCTILDAINKRVTAQLETIKASILELIGDAFKNINLNSPKQLEHLLFEHLQLPPRKKTTGKTGYSTDQEVLEELALLHPVPGLIIQYRELFKLKSTYIDALPTYINKETGNVHTTFSQTAVATGRLASSDPNLQNIPADAASKEMHVRSAFKPTQGHIFLSADYSQIELRVLAHLSGDANLIKAFNNTIDIHQETASKLFDIPLDQVAHEQRQIGKRINFSILYGLTPFGLSKDLKIPFKDAKTYIEKYFAQYPGVSAWMEEVIEETKQHGYVTTLWGRRRYIPGIYENNKTLYDLARRIAINTKAQGTAAELMKLGMISLDKALKENNLHATMTLQIHDELLFSVPLNEQEQTAALVKEVLENVVQWKIQLSVTTRFGDTWYDVTK
jgi:DNA polymerase-1